MTPCRINLVTYVSSAFKYLVKYDGKTIETTVTNQGAVAEEWVSEILVVHSDNKNPVVGLDIKWDDSPNELPGNHERLNKWAANVLNEKQVCTLWKRKS
nr:Werner syndrome-like exonuclease [Tanacetum cinerariifolium]